VIAYQTAYLKANYPAEYMAAVLTNNLNDIKKITFFIDESHRQNIDVLGPNVNESHLNFMVNEKGDIRFGLAAIKNVGENAAENIILEREENGHYRSVFDFAKRVNLKSVNKRSMEALAMAGAFDCFENTHRAQFFFRENSDDSIFLEKIVKHCSEFQLQKNSAQASLFGDAEELTFLEPPLPVCPPWTKLEQLKNEKEVTGFYMSGHPLEDYKIEIDHFCNATINDLKNNRERFKNQNVAFAGILTVVQNKLSQKGQPYATFTMEDFTDFDLYFLFSEEYLKMKHFLIEGSSLLVKARVQERNQKNGQLDIRISNISLLSEALDRNAKKMVVKMNLHTVTADLVNKLSELIKKSPGECSLSLKVRDAEANIEVTLPSSKTKVAPSSFAREMSQLEGVDFILS
jgi:DNA polymerase-3 subunit alpha